MAFANLASLTKKHRIANIITDIGASGLMNFYTGTIPASPDLTATGSLLATLPLSTTAGVASLAVRAGIVTAPGTGGTDGIYALTISGGGGSGAAATFKVQGGVLVSITMTNNGFGYTSPPTLAGFGAASLSGATATAVMTGILVFNSITATTGIANGTAGYVRVTTAGNVGIIDLDVGTTNAYSVIMDSTFISNGGMVTCTADVLIEA